AVVRRSNLKRKRDVDKGTESTPPKPRKARKPGESVPITKADKLHKANKIQQRAERELFDSLGSVKKTSSTAVVPTLTLTASDPPNSNTATTSNVVPITSTPTRRTPAAIHAVATPSRPPPPSPKKEYRGIRHANPVGAAIYDETVRNWVPNPDCGCTICSCN